jgi:hypothetical protein
LNQGSHIYKEITRSNYLSDYGIDWMFTEQVILIVLGFGLGYLAQILTQKVEIDRTKKKTALVIGYEIEYNRKTTDRNITTLREAIRRSREALKSDEIELSRINVILQTSAFDNPQTELAPLKASLVAKIIDFYRWLGYAEHDKLVNNQTLSDIRELANTRPPGKGDLERIKLKAEGSIQMVEWYVKSLTVISAKAIEILEELQEIEKIDINSIELPEQQIATTDKIEITRSLT